MAKSMPDIGAPVATEKPAQAPPVMEYRLHALYFLGNRCIVPLPIAVPICTEGPSLPRGTPIRNEERESTNIPAIFLTHLKVMMPRRTVIEVGIPPPLRLGAFL